MSKIDKALDRFYSIPKDLTWEELVKVLESKGYSELKKGKTGGSRRKFANASKHVLILHKPHPGNIVKTYAIEQVIESIDSQNTQQSISKPEEEPVKENKGKKKPKKNRKR